LIRVSWTISHCCFSSCNAFRPSLRSR
jgi:hypothetical protein